jgi:glycine/D-amino acid oxidase-like deaminating enzyme
MHVLVVGGGIVGLCTAWAVARAGHQVEVFDQGGLPNPQSASNDEHRLIRYFYPDQPGYCRLVDDAFAAWERLWTAIGRRHYAETGALAISTRVDDWTDRARRTLDMVGQPYDRFDSNEVARRWPFLLTKASYAIRTRRGGVLFAERILTDLITLLAGHQVQRHASSPVVGVDAARGTIKLKDGTSRTADAVVIACGAWLPRLVPDLADRVTPVRNVLIYLEPPLRLIATWATAPAIIELGAPGDIYAVPPVGGTNLKFGIGAHRRPGDPDRDRGLASDEAAQLMSHLRSAIADLGSYYAKTMRSCFYALTPDDRFIFERREKLWIVSACAGHGFKFGAVTGELVADAVTGKADPDVIARRLAGH